MGEARASCRIGVVVGVSPELAPTTMKRRQGNCRTVRARGVLLIAYQLRLRP